MKLPKKADLKTLCLDWELIVESSDGFY